MSPLDDLLNSVTPAAAPPSTEKAEGEEHAREPGSIFDLPYQPPTQSGGGGGIDHPYVKWGSSATPEELVEGWLTRFSKADASITWLDAEREFRIPLDPSGHTILVGRRDAYGLTSDGEQFFGEWKSKAPPPKNKREEWKATWRMNPQSLTYGVATEILNPGTRRFTVRMAFKSSPPTFDYEWFSYTTEEIAWWREELLRIAQEIRARRAGDPHGPWSPNFNHCFKYGVRYACPFFQEACSKLKWDVRPVGMIPRVSHLQTERELQEEGRGTFGQAMDKRLVVIDATRVDTWINCHERYRREHEWEGGVMEGEKGEALAIGGAMHDLLEAYYRRKVRR